LQHAIEGCAWQSIQSTFAIKYEISERQAHGITLKVREVLGTHFAPNEFRSPSDFISTTISREFIKKRTSESGVARAPDWPHPNGTARQRAVTKSILTIVNVAETLSRID
jgi:hypothetical protein